MFFFILTSMMKLFFLIFLTILSVSCKKHNLNKPCTIALENSFSTSNNASDENYSAEAKITRITFFGEREEGSAVEIEQLFDNQLILFKQNNALGIDFDIPVGIYTNYNLKIRLAIANSLEIKKEGNNASQKPITIHFEDDLDLNFLSTSKTNELKKKQHYAAKLSWDFDALFLGVTSQALDNAPTTIVGGKATVIISENSNKELFVSIKKNISSALQIKIE